MTNPTDYTTVNRYPNYDKPAALTTPNLKDFYYGTFFEVECPSCAESAVFSSKTEAQEWARSHKNNHRYSRRFNDARSRR